MPRDSTWPSIVFVGDSCQCTRSPTWAHPGSTPGYTPVTGWLAVGMRPSSTLFEFTGTSASYNEYTSGALWAPVAVEELELAGDGRTVTEVPRKFALSSQACLAPRGRARQVGLLRRAVSLRQFSLRVKHGDWAILDTSLDPPIIFSRRISVRWTREHARPQDLLLSLAVPLPIRGRGVLE